MTDPAQTNKPPLGLVLGGQVIEVGDLADDGLSLGARIETADHQVVTISGLTREQCRSLGRLFLCDRGVVLSLVEAA